MPVAFPSSGPESASFPKPYAGVFLAFMVCFSFLSASQAAPGRSVMENYAQGRSSYKMGYWLTVGGLAVMFVPPIIAGENSDPLAFLGVLGLVAYEVGIPMMGANANKMAESVAASDSGYAPPMTGWLWYATGKGLQGFAFLMLAGQAFVYAGSYLVPEGGEPSSTLLDMMVYPLVAGLAFEGLSWYQFSRVHASAVTHAPAELKLSFGLQKGSGSLPIPGVVLALDF